MKTWTMPRVAVEAFRANEYVSACSDYVVSFDGNATDLYVDLDHDGKFDNNYENIQQKSGNYYKLGDSDYAQLDFKAYTNVSIYKIRPFSGIWNQRAYSDFCTLVGNSYTIYVVGFTADDRFKIWIYSDGYVPPEVPSDGKQWS